MKKYRIHALPVCIPESLAEVQDIFLVMLKNSERHIVTFLNPEFFLEAERNAAIHQYLCAADYTFVDGNGILLAINRKMGTAYTTQYRYAGPDFFTFLPIDMHIRVFLYGASEENNALAAERIPRQFPQVEICGRQNGYDAISDDELIGKIHAAKTDILIVCLGCPKQEYWIMRNASWLETKIIVGNGGAIDFWSGSVKRAPLWMREHRMEWLYRLLQDFTLSRLKRQLRLVLFAVRILFGRFDIQAFEESSADAAKD